MVSIVIPSYSWRNRDLKVKQNLAQFNIVSGGTNPVGSDYWAHIVNLLLKR